MSQISRALIYVSLILNGATAFAGIEAEPNEWIMLFNGNNLDGWTVKITGQPLGVDPANTFRVADGLLQVRYDDYETFDGQFGHLFYQYPFSHYALQVEYRFTGEQLKGGPAGWAVRNSGVMLHAQAPATMTLQQDFPTSIEAQFLGGLSDGKARPTASVCTPGTDISVDGQIYAHHCLPSRSATYDGDQWVSMTVVVLGGGRITHYVEGEEVLSYHQPQLDTAQAHAKNKTSKSLGSGYIALQSESHPVDFRQVRLLNLAGCTDPDAKNHQVYFIKSEPGSCIY